MEKELDIVAITRSTAKNLYELMLELAIHIEKLEAENDELRRKLNSETDDLK